MCEEWTGQTKRKKIPRGGPLQIENRQHSLGSQNQAFVGPTRERLRDVFCSQKSIFTSIPQHLVSLRPGTMMLSSGFTAKCCLGNQIDEKEKRGQNGQKRFVLLGSFGVFPSTFDGNNSNPACSGYQGPAARPPPPPPRTFHPPGNGGGKGDVETFRIWTMLFSETLIFAIFLRFFLICVPAAPRAWRRFCRRGPGLSALLHRSGMAALPALLAELREVSFAALRCAKPAASPQDAQALRVTYSPQKKHTFPNKFSDLNFLIFTSFHTDVQRNVSCCGDP